MQIPAKKVLVKAAAAKTAAYEQQLLASDQWSNVITVCECAFKVIPA
jgi:hypothetical protein